MVDLVDSFHTPTLVANTPKGAHCSLTRHPRPAQPRRHSLYRPTTRTRPDSDQSHPGLQPIGFDADTPYGMGVQPRAGIAAFTVTVALVAVYIHSTPSHYRATARALVGPDLTVTGSEAPGGPATEAGINRQIHTQSELLHNASLVRETVRRLEASRATGEPASPPTTLLSVAGDWLRSAAVSAGLGQFPTDTPASGQDFAETAAFSARLQVSPVPGTWLVELSFTATDAQVAAKTINTHVATYIEHRRAEQLATIEEALAWIRTRAAEQRQTLDGIDGTGPRREGEIRRYEQLLQQQLHLELSALHPMSNLRLIQPAPAPTHTIHPERKQAWLVGVLGGLVLALVVGTTAHHRETIRHSNDVTRRLGRPLLGRIPAGQSRPPRVSNTNERRLHEAFRELRTQLLFTTDRMQPSVLRVTGPQRTEGTTTIAANLALTLALGGSRVLLIDSDLQHPGAHETLGISNTVGLSHLVVGQTSARDAIQPTHEPNLFALTAGYPVANPTSLFASGRMRTLLASLRESPFDWIVIDSPPPAQTENPKALAVDDSRTLLVLEAGRTRARTAAQAITALERSDQGMRILGIVLNRA